MKQAYQNLLYLDNRTKASIAARIDEAAFIFHPMVRQRLILVSLAALVATKIAPLWVCGLWLLGLTGLEIWNWIASKKQFARQYVDPNSRLSFFFLWL